MKASGFTDAQKKFSLKQGDDGGGGGDLPAGGSQPGDLLQLEEVDVPICCRRRCGG